MVARSYGFHRVPAGEMDAAGIDIRGYRKIDHVNTTAVIGHYWSADDMITNSGNGSDQRTANSRNTDKPCFYGGNGDHHGRGDGHEQAGLPSSSCHSHGLKFAALQSVRKARRRSTNSCALSKPTFNQPATATKIW